jgi:hypothetical protein
MFCIRLFNFVNYVFLLLCLCILIVMYVHSRYCVSLCCVYSLCVCTVVLPPGVNPISVNKCIIYHELDRYFMLDWGSGCEASPSWIRGQFLTDSCEQV